MKIKFDDKKLWFTIISLAVMITSIATTIYSSIQINKFENSNLISVKNKQKELFQITSDSIDKRFGLLANAVDQYASQITKQEITPNQIGKLIYKDNNINNGNVLGVGIIQITNDTIRTDRLYWQFQGSQLINSHYKISMKPEENWLKSYKDSQSHWSRPYYDKVLQQYVVSYSRVFYAKNSNRVTGAIVIDLGLKSIIDLISQNIGEKFTSIITDNGYYIYDINPQNIFNRGNLLQNNGTDKQIYDLAKKTPCLNQVCHNKLTNKEYYFIYKHMTNMPWVIFSKYNKTELESLVHSTPNKLIMIKIGSIVIDILSLTILILILVTNKRNTINNLWLGSSIIAIVCLLGTIYIWNKSEDLYYLNDQNALTSNIKLQSALKSYYRDAKLRNFNSILEIPTAIKIDSIEFLTAYNLQISGTIMQSYPKGYNITDGIKFNHSYDTKFTKVTDINYSSNHVVVWTFQTKIRENFDYQHYPFNHAKIWLSLSPFNSESNIVFTPNFAFYNGLTDVTANFGVNQEIIIPGWHINGSFFNYINDSSRMLDEIDAYDIVRLPSLTFNMLIDSSISDAIITTIIPPTVIILILFVLLLTITRHKNRFIEFKVSGIISACGGMLFTIVFSHVSLRNRITSEMMYIEYIYLIMYIMVLLIPINAILFAKGKNRLIRYGNNIIFKLLFLPLLMGFMFIMTLISFS